MDKDNLPKYFAGIGASAGGLEALELFFQNMPLNTKTAFIVVQHLSPDYKSYMVELLEKKTELQVHRAEDGMEVFADNIYLIPPKKNMTIFHGKLILTEQDHSRGINLPIDIFLKSLAADKKEKAIGIILSGTGSDGMQGVRNIKEAGGIVIVQNEQSAKFDGMPRSAVSTGLADLVVSPDQMPEALVSIAAQNFNDLPGKNFIKKDEDNLTKIFSLLRSLFKTDFTFYKHSTVIRRIERRISINRLNDIDEYVNFINENKTEALTLYKELLIGVTGFFRDREVFDLLSEKIIPELIKNAGNELRIWSAGCSTGEEAYSIAILCAEAMSELNLKCDVKIFATDIDKDSLLKAGQGEYPESLAADISPEILTKYFIKKNDSFAVASKIREMVVFARHDIINDPPFAKMNMISCRNLLIYLQPVLQQKILEFFNFSLAKDGILLLGTSETTGELSEYFEPVNHKLKTYKALGKKLPPRIDETLPGKAVRSKNGYSHSASDFNLRSSKSSYEEKILERLLETLSDEVIPLTLVVNDKLEVLRVSGDTKDYFRLPSGRMYNEITKMACDSLSIPLSSGLQKVFSKNENIRYSKIKIQNNNQTKFINLSIRQLTKKTNDEPLAAVIIEELGEPDLSSASSYTDYDMDQEAKHRITDLEQELQFTKESLQATIEELETSNEELQATNEELLASNEELQSTNEELQSVNEELYTVNTEHQQKIIELTELNNDMDNLLASTQISTLFLDENSEIRKFSHEVQKIFNIVDHDIGRPIDHINHSIVNLDPLKIIERVQKTNEPEETEALTSDNKTYLMRILPYSIGPLSFSGLVITFIDITRIKEAENDLRKESSLVSAIIETTPTGITMVDKYGQIIFANKKALEMFGLTKEEVKKRGFNSEEWEITDCSGKEFKTENLPFTIVKKTLKPVKNIEHHIKTKAGKTVCLSISSAPLFDQSDQFSGMVSVLEDTTYKCKNK
ncbi:MAG: chemotaxis protein CheB [Thermodesulfobacteriota bacterium]